MAIRRRATRSTKGEPFTVRFDRETQQAIEAEARRTQRTRTALVEDLADEALRSRRFPGLGFRDSYPRRRAWVIGAGLDVWELCDLVDLFPDVETLLADFPHLHRSHVDLALAYRDAHREEIDGLIEENNRSPDEWRRLYPFVRDAV